MSVIQYAKINTMELFNIKKHYFIWFIVPIFQLLTFVIVGNLDFIFTSLGSGFYPYLSTIFLPIVNLFGFLIIAFFVNTSDDLWEEAPILGFLGIAVVFFLTTWISLQFLSPFNYVFSSSYTINLFTSQIILYFIISFFIYLSYFMISIFESSDDNSLPIFGLLFSLGVYLLGIPWFVELVQL